MGDGPERRLVGGLIEPPPFRIGADGREFADIGARGEGFPARSPQDHDAHRRVPVEGRHDLGKRLPHLQIHGVVLGRIVDGERRKTVGNRNDKLGRGG